MFLISQSFVVENLSTTHSTTVKNIEYNMIFPLTTLYGNDSEGNDRNETVLIVRKR